MKSLRNLALVFALALLAYAAFYFGIEHLRARKGPWQVTFKSTPSGTPLLLINQPALGITNVQIIFPEAANSASPPATLVFDHPREVPYDLPFGRCRFMDTTFLP